MLAKVHTGCSSCWAINVDVRSDSERARKTSARTAFDASIIFVRSSSRSGGCNKERIAPTTQTARAPGRADEAFGVGCTVGSVMLCNRVWLSRRALARLLTLTGSMYPAVRIHERLRALLHRALLLLRPLLEKWYGSGKARQRTGY